MPIDVVIKHFFSSLLLRSVAFTYSISTRITKRRITWTRQFRKNQRSKIKARAPSGRSPVPFLGKGLRPPALEGRARARARARALSTTANHGISLFFKGNFRFDQGKSCSVPRVWQLCKISARSVPVSKRYDQRKFIKKRFSLKFIGHVKKSKSQDLQFSASKREFL